MATNNPTSSTHTTDHAKHDGTHQAHTETGTKATETHPDHAKKEGGVKHNEPTAAHTAKPAEAAHTTHTKDSK